MVDIIDPDRWWYQMVVELMERLHPDNFRIKSGDLVTVPKAAKQLVRGKVTLYRWIKANKIIYVELGGVLFIPKRVVERLKNERVAESEKSAEKGELPDGFRDDMLAVWRSKRDRVVKELEGMFLGHMRDEIVVGLIKRLRER